MLRQREEGRGEVPVVAGPQVYRTGRGGRTPDCRGRERLDKALLKVLRFPVMFWMMNIQVGEHPSRGATRYGHLRATVEAGAQTGAGVADTEEKIILL